MGFLEVPVGDFFSHGILISPIGLLLTYRILFSHDILKNHIGEKYSHRILKNPICEYIYLACEVKIKEDKMCVRSQ